LEKRRWTSARALAKVLPDPRDPSRTEHPLLALVRQRIYGLAQGYEDLNDHDTLRHDLAWQTAVERDGSLRPVRRCADWRTEPTGQWLGRCIKSSSSSSSLRLPSPHRVGSGF
jgi:hypothetical protein